MFMMLWKVSFSENHLDRGIETVVASKSPSRSNQVLSIGINFTQTFLPSTSLRTTQGRTRFPNENHRTAPSADVWITDTDHLRYGVLYFQK